MAEPTIDQFRQLSEVFLLAFNKEHSSNFRLDDVPVGSFADFFIRDGDDKIPVQHVRAMEYPQNDVVKPLKASEFVNRLLGKLESDGVSGIFISLSVQALPKDMDDLTYRVADFVSAEKNWSPAIFRFDVKRDFERYGLKDFIEFVPSIEICSMEAPGVVIGHDCADVPSTPHLDDQQVLEATIARKSKKYGLGLRDTILLVEAWPNPFWSFYMEKARIDRQGAASGFREIWAVSLSGAEKRAWRIA